MGPILPAPAGAQEERVAQQAITGTFQEVPAAIKKLHAEASDADDRGERQKALALQQDVMTWVKANLLAVHPFRAEALNNLGIYLSKMGQRAEALPPTLEAVKIRREQAKTNAAFLPDLARALNNLGIRYRDLNQLDEAFPHAEKAVRLFTQLVATYPARFKDDLQRARNTLENLRRKEDLQLGRKRAISPNDRTYLNTNDPPESHQAVEIPWASAPA
jgi:tetratricopeptide (TPR) repeat protein